MKVFLTGAKQCGKSTLIKRYLNESDWQICGYQTLPLIKDGVRTGFYMHALVDWPINDVQFSVQKIDHNEVISDVFETFGIEILKESLKYSDRLMILDEIGYIERNERAYLDVLMHCIQTHPHVLGVLRKCEIAYIEEIKQLKDVLVLDLDEIGSDTAYMQLRKALKKL